MAMRSVFQQRRLIGCQPLFRYTLKKVVQSAKPRNFRHLLTRAELWFYFKIEHGYYMGSWRSRDADSVEAVDRRREIDANREMVAAWLSPWSTFFRQENILMRRISAKTPSSNREEEHIALFNFLSQLRHSIGFLPNPVKENVIFGFIHSHGNRVGSLMNSTGDRLWTARRGPMTALSS
jgi:hypothetical protein